MNAKVNEIKIETLESMAKRLRGTGGGAQAEAVIEAIKAINGAAGILDVNNRTTAIYHLAVALSGDARAGDTILLTAGLFDTAC
jgi:hypothetical protein